MSSLESWLNTQITMHNIRVSPRLPLDERVKHFIMRWAVQNGRQIDDMDADLAAMLVSMSFREVTDANIILDQLRLSPVARESLTASWESIAEPQRRRSRRHQ